MSVLDTITGTLSAAISLLPRLVPIRETEAGVLFGRRDGKARELSPGLRFWWPVLGDLDIVCIAPQPLQMEGQALTTEDGRSLYVSGTVRYEVEDVLAYAVRNVDTVDAIMEMSRATIRSVIVSMQLDEILHDQAGLDEAIFERLRERLRPFGVAVLSAQLDELAVTRPLHHLGIPLPAGKP